MKDWVKRRIMIVIIEMVHPCQDMYKLLSKIMWKSQIYEKLHWATSVQVCFKRSKYQCRWWSKGVGRIKGTQIRKKVEENNGLMILPIAAVRRRSVLAKAALRSWNYLMFWNSYERQNFQLDIFLIWRLLGCGLVLLQEFQEP